MKNTRSIDMLTLVIWGSFFCGMGCGSEDSNGDPSLLEPSPLEDVVGVDGAGSQDVRGPEDDVSGSEAGDTEIPDGETSDGFLGVDAADDASDGGVDASADVSEESPPVEVFEYTRLSLKQPARLWSLRARVQVSQPELVHLHVWDDFGGNFVSFRHETPLATGSVEVTPEDNGTWVSVPLLTPIDVDPERLIYVGLVLDATPVAPSNGVPVPENTVKGETEWIGVHDGTSIGVNQYEAWPLEGFPQLHVDAEATDPEGDKPPHSLVWSPNDPADASGFPPIAASRDFMIELEVEWIHTVEETDFEWLEGSVSGLPGFSRAAVEDVDGDGAVDLLYGGSGLWINNGAGEFTDETALWFPEGIPGNGMFGDYDNDGDPDFFETGGADRLFRNDGGLFVDVTLESGIDDTQSFLCDGVNAVVHAPTESASWLDANGDGWLDLYLGNFICWTEGLGSQDQLWLNQGDGTFVNATETASMSQGQQLDPENDKYFYLASRGTAPADHDNDGDMDLFVGNYRLHRNLLWDQTSPGVFQNLGLETQLEGYGIKQGFQTWYGHTIGAVWGDVDNDGDLDIFHANLAHPRFFDFSDLATLYINEGGAAAQFTDVGEEIGIRYQETPSNPNFLDFDNDGDLDLFYTCIYEDRPSQFYRNDGHPAWKEVSYSTGVHVMNGWGSVTADIDQDGDVDLLASTGNYRNKNLGQGGSIFVRPMGSGAGKTNKSGFGARAQTTVNGKLQMRELAGSHGTSVQSSPFLHFGLGGEEMASLEVIFPLSDTTVLVPDVPAGSRLIVHEDGTIEIL